MISARKTIVGISVSYQEDGKILICKLEANDDEGPVVASRDVCVLDPAADLADNIIVRMIDFTAKGL